MGLRIILGKIGFISAVALTCGAIAGMLAELAKANGILWFCFGSFVPFWPLLAYLSSTCYLRKTIGKYEKMYQDKVITQRQFQALRRAAVESHSYLRYGETKLADLNEEDSKSDDDSD